MKILLIILDSAGVGALPDARLYGDTGAATLQHVLEHNPGLSLPRLRSLGLGNIDGMSPYMPSATQPKASYGKAAERSAGKDTLVGHWELMGVVTEEPFETFPDGFPPEIIRRFRDAAGREILGNTTASGTAIIQEYGDEHVQTGKPIVYTSADSVFQIAAHEEVIPLDMLYGYCAAAREVLRRTARVGRVIARPFAGTSGAYVRTVNRRDFLVDAPRETVMTRLKDSGVPVIGVGKIEDIFGGLGLTKSRHTHGNKEGVAAVIEEARGLEHGLVFANLVDYDMLYGHRRDVLGYGRALEAFDLSLPAIMDTLKKDDVLIITADHGCDPIHTGTDHTREYVPVLLYRKGDGHGVNIGTRESFADVGAMVLELFGLPIPFEGKRIL